jgi:hypothetical protein
MSGYFETLRSLWPPVFHPSLPSPLSLSLSLFSPFYVSMFQSAETLPPLIERQHPRKGELEKRDLYQSPGKQTAEKT